MTLSNCFLYLWVKLHPLGLKRCLHVGLEVFWDLAAETMLPLSVILCPLAGCALESSFQMKMFTSYFSTDIRHGVFEVVNSQVIRSDIRKYRQVHVSIFKTYNSIVLKINQVAKPVMFT